MVYSFNRIVVAKCKKTLLRSFKFLSSFKLSTSSGIIHVYYRLTGDLIAENSSFSSFRSFSPFGPLPSLFLPSFSLSLCLIAVWQLPVCELGCRMQQTHTHAHKNYFHALLLVCLISVDLITGCRCVRPVQLVLFSNLCGFHRRCFFFFSLSLLRI